MTKNRLQQHLTFPAISKIRSAKKRLSKSLQPTTNYFKRGTKILEPFNLPVRTLENYSKAHHAKTANQTYMKEVPHSTLLFKEPYSQLLCRNQKPMKQIARLTTKQKSKILRANLILNSIPSRMLKIKILKSVDRKLIVHPQWFHIIKNGYNHPEIAIQKIDRHQASPALDAP
jgi:hypothetical protein